jgi:hypothetical protein
LAVLDWVDETWRQEVGPLVERKPDPVDAPIALAPPGPPARVVALALIGAMEGAVIELAGQAPHDELLAARAAAGVLGVDLEALGEEAGQRCAS